MRDLTFSVVLPTYGRPDGLLLCLGGLARLDYPADRFEVIVVSDGPGLPDASAIAQAAAGLSYQVEQQDHRGPAAARNRGAALATGRYLAFIDDDCMPEPRWLSALAIKLAGGSDMMVGGRTVNALRDRACPDATQLLVDFLSAYYDGSRRDRTRFFPTSNLAVPTEAFRALGGFDRQFAYAGGEDRDFCDRWHASGRLSAHEPGAVVHHSHRLTFGQFLDQHFRYGRGALRFHRAKRAREAGREGVPLRFYADLIRYPLSRRRPAAGLVRAGLLVLAQVATAAGYWWERLESGRGSDPGAPPPQPQEGDGA